MRNLLFAAIILSAIFTACKTNMNGLTEIKTPFSGNKYESNNRWLRAVASGESLSIETSKDKAMLSAKQRLAGSIQTQLKNVSENYKGERIVGDNVGDFNERFQQLTRDVTNQTLVELQLIDQKVFQNDKNKNYVTWVAIEARKKTVYNKLKEIANTRASLSDKDKAYISNMLDNAIKDLDDNE